MTNITTIIDQEAGIQYQGVEDRSSRTGTYPVIGMITGQFRRGRFDKPMTITNENIKAQLGYDPTNPHYMAVQDVLSSGVPSVQVLRVGETIDPKPNLPNVICAGAPSGVTLRNAQSFADLSLYGTAPTMDVYINDVLAGENMSMFIHDMGGVGDSYKAPWEALRELHQLSISSDSQNYLHIYNNSSMDKRIAFIPKTDGEYGGNVYPAIDFLISDPSSDNSSVINNDEGGVIGFCLSVQS